MSDSVGHHRWQPTRLPRPWDSPGKNTGVGCHFLLQCMKVKNESEVVQLCPTFSDPMDCSLPGSSVHGIFQARALEWVPLPAPPPYSGPTMPITCRKGRRVENHPMLMSHGLPGGSVMKNPPTNAGDLGRIPGPSRSTEGGKGNPLQYSCLGNPVDRGASWARVLVVSKSQTQLSEYNSNNIMNI